MTFQKLWVEAVIIASTAMLSIAAHAKDDSSTNAEKAFHAYVGKYAVASQVCLENDVVKACESNPKEIQVDIRGESLCYKFVENADTQSSRCMTEFDAGNSGGYRYRSYFEVSYGEARHITEFNTSSMISTEVFSITPVNDQFEIAFIYKKISYDAEGKESSRFNTKEVYRVRK